MSERLDNIRLERAKLVKERKIQKKENAEIARLENDVLIDRDVDLSLEEDVTEFLNDIEAQCEAVVNSIDIYSAKTRENRKWNPGKEYSFSTQLNKFTSILIGIQYSADDHRVQMLALLGLSETIVAKTVKAFGKTAYYSKNYKVIVDEIPYNIDELQHMIGLMEKRLNISLDSKLLNDVVMRNKFVNARGKAETDEATAIKTDATGNQQTLIDVE